MSLKSLNISSVRLARMRLKITHKAAVAAATAASIIIYNHDIYLKDKDNANAAKILEITLNIRAKNTAKNYKSKQKEFSDWALNCGYADGDTVTEAKLLSFLQENVVNRPLRKKGRKALAADEIDLED